MCIRDSIQDRLELGPGDLSDQISLIRILEEYRPDEVYNLAAQSFVQTSWNQPVFTGDVTALEMCIRDRNGAPGYNVAKGDPPMPFDWLKSFHQEIEKAPDYAEKTLAAYRLGMKAKGSIRGVRIEVDPEGCPASRALDLSLIHI